MPLVCGPQDRLPEPSMYVPVRSSKGQTWCGPYALACIAGIDYDEAKAIIQDIVGRQHNGHRAAIKGVSNRVMVSALIRSGFFVHHRAVRHDRPTVRRFLEETQPGREVILMNVTDHYITYRSGTLSDPENGVQAVERFKGLRKHIIRYWAISGPWH